MGCDRGESDGLMKVLDHGFVELIDSMPAAVDVVDVWGAGDQRVVDAARVSITGRGVRAVSDDKKLLRYLLTNRHTSPFEKVRFEFDVKLPIFVARQWVRHRTGSFNEMSARYGVMADDFYVPARDRMQAQATDNKQGSGDILPIMPAIDAKELIRASSNQAYADYKELLAIGLARELARMVLPVNLYTRWWWTVDLHNLMGFLRLRLHSHAQYEIRVYAEAIRALVRGVAPFTMSVFDETIGVPHV